VLSVNMLTLIAQSRKTLEIECR